MKCLFTLKWFRGKLSSVFDTFVSKLDTIVPWINSVLSLHTKVKNILFSYLSHVLHPEKLFVSIKKEAISKFENSIVILQIQFLQCTIIIELHLYTMQNVCPFFHVKWKKKEIFEMVQSVCIMKGPRLQFDDDFTMNYFCTMRQIKSIFFHELVYNNFHSIIFRTFTRHWKWWAPRERERVRERGKCRLWNDGQIIVLLRANVSYWVWRPVHEKKI